MKIESINYAMEFTINEFNNFEEVLAPEIAIAKQNVDSLAELLNSLNIESAKKAAPKKSKSEDDDEDDDFENEDDDFLDDDFEDEGFEDIDPDFEEFDLPKSKGSKSSGKSKSLEDEFGDDFGDLNIFDDEDGFNDDF